LNQILLTAWQGKYVTEVRFNPQCDVRMCLIVGKPVSLEIF